MLVLAVAFNLAAAPPSAAADESVLGLDGAWRLDRTENFEPYLKKSGASWWKRKLAKLGSSRMRQTISQEGQRFEITGENPVETRTEKFVADGVTELSAETATGEMMTWTARVEGAALVIDGQGELGHRIVRREIVDDGMVMTIFNPDADTQCKLYFERAESD